MIEVSFSTLLIIFLIALIIGLIVGVRISRPDIR